MQSSAGCRRFPLRLPYVDHSNATARIFTYQNLHAGPLPQTLACLIYGRRSIWLWMFIRFDRDSGEPSARSTPGDIITHADARRHFHPQQLSAASLPSSQNHPPASQHGTIEQGKTILPRSITREASPRVRIFARSLISPLPSKICRRWEAATARTPAIGTD